MPGSLREPHGGAADISGTRILVVEDDFLLAEVLEQSLCDMGAEAVGPATSLEEGLALIESESFDLALLDASLRGRSVHPLAEALRERDIPFVFLSGYRKLTELQTRFPDVPAFEKPTNFEALQTAIAALLVERSPNNADERADGRPDDGI